MSPRSRKSDGAPPPLHPLLTFQFEKDTQATPSKRRRRERTEPPASIAEALSRWLEEEL